MQGFSANTLAYIRSLMLFNLLTTKSTYKEISGTGAGDGMQVQVLFVHTKQKPILF